MRGTRRGASIGAAVLVAAMTVATLPAAGRAAVPDSEAAPIPFGDVVLAVERFVEIPDDSRPAPPRLNVMTSVGNRVFVGEEHDGRIYELVDRYTASPRARLFFDVGDGIAAATGRHLDTSSSFHGGLRGVAFHPEFASNGLFYTSVMESRPSDPAGHTYLSDAGSNLADGVVIEWRLRNGSVDPSSYREVFRVGVPEQDHMIKEIAFDPHARPGDEDYGLLYVAHGDGSVESTVVGGGLRRDDALGKILRVDPRRSGSAPYRVPASNPFVGPDGTLDEIYTLGHRNPHNLTFARWRGATHLVVGEAGRDNVEEINVIHAGRNYGWAAREGTYVHLGQGGFLEGLDPLPASEDGRYTFPAAQWLHQDVDRGAGFVGQAAAGGHVVTNGSSLHGLYLHADFAYEGKVFSTPIDDLLDAVTRIPAGGGPGDLTQAPIHQVRIRFEDGGSSQVHPVMRDILQLEDRYEPGGDVGRSDLRFGQDPDGTIYIMNKRNGWIYRVIDSIPPGGPGSRPAPGVPGPGHEFVDDDGSVFEEDIEWLAARGITRGCNPPVNDRFCPDDTVTRGQMAAFLVRALGLPDAPGAGFVDTGPSVFADDIDRLAAADITRGCTADRFCPDDEVTRGQMAAFLVRAYHLTGVPQDAFVDVDGSVFVDDIRRLAAAGVTRGCNPPANDRYCPADAVTRGQMAAFIRRAES